MTTLRRYWVFFVVLLVVIVAIASGVVSVRELKPAGQDIPTVRVLTGEVVVRTHAMGELRASRSAALIAPQVPGALRIVTLPPSGSPIEAGDLVIDFDAAEQEYALEQSRSELLQAEQEILKMKADAAVQAAEDEVALLTARFDVRRAELDVRGNEFLGAIEARKNLLTLEEARRRLAQLEDDVASHVASSEASLAVVEERRLKAQLGMEQAQQNIDNLRIHAPFDGLLSVRENRDSTGGFFFFGMVIPEYQPGDLAFPGRLIADVLDVSRMEIVARVNESEGANLSEGLPAQIEIEALPGRMLRAEVASVSGQASRGSMFFGAGPTRQFDVTFRLLDGDVELRPGASTRIIVEGQRLQDVAYLPRQAIFERDGKPVVYVRNGADYEMRDVRVTHRTESQAVVEDLEPGTEVAVVNPETVRGSRPSASGAVVPPAAVGGIQ
jgi:HlyD family secretion protein